MYNNEGIGSYGITWICTVALILIVIVIFIALIVNVCIPRGKDMYYEIEKQIGPLSKSKPINDIHIVEWIHSGKHEFKNKILEYNKLHSKVAFKDKDSKLVNSILDSKLDILEKAIERKGYLSDDDKLLMVGYNKILADKYSLTLYGTVTDEKRTHYNICSNNMDKYLLDYIAYIKGEHVLLAFQAHDSYIIYSNYIIKLYEWCVAIHNTDIPYHRFQKIID